MSKRYFAAHFGSPLRQCARVVVSISVISLWLVSFSGSKVTAQEVSPEGRPDVPTAGQPSELEGNEANSQVLRDDEGQIDEFVQQLPEEVRAVASKARQAFRTTEKELSEEMHKLRRIQLNYRNGFEQNPAAVIKFRKQRNLVWNLMQTQFDNALEVFRYLPSPEAASFLVTKIQHDFEHDIYDARVFEASARLLDTGQRLRFLFLAGARSGIVSGNFEAAKKIYETLQDEDMEDADRKLLFLIEKIQKQYEDEQKAIAATDEGTLPRVAFETTMGSVTVELFPDAAPSAVAHFIELVEDGFYDGLDFSVVTHNVLALTGDNSDDGRGTSGEFLLDEHGQEQSRHALRGSLIMAKIPIGDGKFIENSASSQFAIAFLPITSVSDSQTVFGRVVEGMDVVSRVRRVDPTKEKKKGEVILPPDAIISAELVRRGPKLPEPKYVDVMAELKKAEEMGLLKRRMPRQAGAGGE